MTKLTILCITNGEPHAGEYIARMYAVAKRIGAQLYLGLDRGVAQAADYPCDESIWVTCHGLQEEVADFCVSQCPPGWVLRLDDDEVISPALEAWLGYERYLHERSGLYAFPRVYQWGDETHIICNDGIYPDLQTRLGLRDMMFGYNHIHAGNPRGTGAVVKCAIEHHKLLVKDLPARMAIAKRYEAIRPGAGLSEVYGRYNTPELFYDPIQTREYTTGDMSND
jgi:hypothetical protein